MIRLFVGLERPEDVRHALAGLCGGVPGADWVAPESMHLTLRFIGDVTEADAEDAHDALMRVRAPGFDLSLHGVGHFSTGDELRALWAGVDRSEPLAQLRRNVDSALVRMGFPPEERRWRPQFRRRFDSPMRRRPASGGSAAPLCPASPPRQLQTPGQVQGVQEVGVVAGHQEGTVIAAQGRLQGLHRIEVEVVGGLIQHQ